MFNVRPTSCHNEWVLRWNSPFPIKRGLVRRLSGDGAEGARRRIVQGIVARGYDTTFNIGEVSWKIVRVLRSYPPADSDLVSPSLTSSRLWKLTPRHRILECSAQVEQMPHLCYRPVAAQALDRPKKLTRAYAVVLESHVSSSW